MATIRVPMFTKTSVKVNRDTLQEEIHVFYGEKWASEDRDYKHGHIIIQASSGRITRHRKPGTPLSGDLGSHDWNEARDQVERHALEAARIALEVHRMKQKEKEGGKKLPSQISFRYATRTLRATGQKVASIMYGEPGRMEDADRPGHIIYDFVSNRILHHRKLGYTPSGMQDSAMWDNYVSSNIVGIYRRLVEDSKKRR